MNLIFIQCLNLSGIKPSFILLSSKRLTPQIYKCSLAFLGMEVILQDEFRQCSLLQQYLLFINDFEKGKKNGIKEMMREC